MVEANMAAERRLRREEEVRRQVMTDTVRDTEELLARNVTARLAYSHFELMGSVSHGAILGYWSGRDHLAACRRAVAA